MSALRFYMDEHIPGALTRGLRKRGLDVATAQEDGRTGAPDSALLDRAHEEGRILFTCDDDFLVEAQRRQTSGIDFAGVVYVHQRNLAIGRCLDELELIARVSSRDEIANQVVFLPL